ncbi:MAG: molybdopterin-dependent oxidoreductase, partial [bacterium]
GSSLSLSATAVANVGAVAALAMLTGNIGRSGTGVYPLSSGANSQGLADMGVRPDRLPGGFPSTDPEARARMEGYWGAALAGASPGRTVTEMLDAAEAGEIGFLYVVGADPALSLADETRVRKALQAVGFLVVEDSFLTDTAGYADVVLPATVASEDDGTFTNGERLVQRVRPAAPALGESLPDWKILRDLANRLGGGWMYDAPEQVMREIAEVVPVYGGVSYARLGHESLQWPCPGTEHPGTPVLHVDEFARGKGAFAPAGLAVAPTGTDVDYPFALLTGAVLEHHGTGVRSRRSAGLTKLVEEAKIEVHPRDAERLGLADGDLVRVVGHTLEAIELPALVSDRIPEGSVFAPGFSPAAPVTRLIARNAQGVPAVRVERLG